VPNDVTFLRRANVESRLARVFLKKPRPTSSPNTTGRGLPVDRGGEGHLHGHAEARSPGGVTLRVYNWRQSRDAEPSPSRQRRAPCRPQVAQVAQFHQASDGVYGGPRIFADLGAVGARVSRKTVAASLRRQGLAGSARGDSRRRSRWSTATRTQVSVDAMVCDHVNVLDGFPDDTL
jgi:hypothetical protein